MHFAPEGIGGGTTPVDAALDPTGVRVATSQASSPSFLLPDLHGNAAGLWGQAAAAFVDATRYDPYGETLDHYPASPTIRTPWRFQGRMLEGEATDTESYDFGFRSFLADVAAFGSLDDVAGQATDVRSLNRFLYAAADPVTLVDPDGHVTMAMDGGAGGSAKPKVTGHHGGPRRLSGGSSRNSYNAGAAARMQRADAGGRRDPVKVTTPVRGDHYDWDAPPASAAGTKGDGGGGFDLGGFVHGGLDVLGFVPVLGAVPDLINAGIYTAEGDVGNAALSATSAIPLAGDAVAAAKMVVKYGDDAIAVAGFVAKHGDESAELLGAAVRSGDDVVEGGKRLLDDVGGACRHSFAATTPVVLADGTSVPIAEVEIGDKVQALDPDAGTADGYEVTATFRHEDPVTGTVVVDGESIATTPGHRFLTDERGWVEAQDLVPGEHVPSVSGGSGVVASISWTGGPRTMYDLTVAQVHTFAVGGGGWVVHNCDVGDFSLVDWSGYPEGLPKPEGPLRVRGQSEYQAALRAKNTENGALHRANPALAGKDIHEIQPVLLGGHPVDPANKIVLDPSVHHEVSAFWARITANARRGWQ